MDQREWVDRMFREHARDLFRYLRTFRLQDDDAYDLVQDSFVRLLGVQPSRVRRPKVWLFTVGRNLAINRLKRNRRWEQDHAVEDLVDSSPGVLSNMLEDEESAVLRQAFSRLSPPERELMHLHLEHEFSYRQIAKVVGKSEIAVRVAMYRSRNRLRALFRSIDGENRKGEGRSS